MLQQLLSIIRSESVLDLKSLAERLNTSPQMVEAMLEHLKRAGYLRPYTSCDTGCQGCELKSSCRSNRPERSGQRLWRLET
jgi:Mn-dependent DtxR family transcriptional regulator